MPGSHLICPLRQGLPFTTQTTALWMGWQKHCVGGCPAEFPAQPCQLRCMDLTQGMPAPHLTSCSQRENAGIGKWNITKQFLFWFLCFPCGPAAPVSRQGRWLGFNSSAFVPPSLHCSRPPSSHCPAAPREGRREREQGRHPVVPGGTFPQGSWQLGDRQQRLPWTPHPTSGWAKDKHTDCFQERFPSCPSFFPHLNFAAALDGAILGLAFFTLEGHRPGGKCQDDGFCESGGEDPAPSAPPDRPEEPAPVYFPVPGLRMATQPPAPLAGVISNATSRGCCCRRGVCVCAHKCLNPCWPWAEVSAPQSQESWEQCFFWEHQLHKSRRDGGVPIWSYSRKRCVPVASQAIPRGLLPLILPRICSTSAVVKRFPSSACL